MKKSIFVLLFLLLGLIVTCVYQKTYALYALQNHEQSTPVQNVTTETTSKKQVIREKEVKKPVKTPKKIQHVVAETKKKVVPNIPTSKVVKTVHTEKVVIPKKVLSPAQVTTTKVVKNKPATPTSKPASVQTTQMEEKEVVDYLLSILNDRDLAIKNRDAVEQNLHLLIKKALEERRIVIQNMEKDAVTRAENLQKALDSRKHSSSSVKENTSERKGK